MTIVDIFLAQLTDPFRVGLIVILALTAINTAATTGYAVPLALGVVFVAVLIPTTMGKGGDGTALAIAVGLVSNTLVLAAVLAARAVVMRLTQRPPR